MAEDASTLVSVLLWEGNLDAAWQSAVEGGCTPRVLLELAERREDDHPADSLPVCQRHIEATVQQKTNRAYEEAVVWIRRVRAVMAHLGKQEEFATYVRGVRARHKPKRNLMSLFDREGW